MTLPAICKRRLAWVGTEALSPFVIAAALMAVVPARFTASWMWQSLLSIVFVVVIPWCLALWLAYSGKTTDKFIPHREQRHRYYALAGGSVLVGAILLLALPSVIEVKILMGTALGTVLVLASLNVVVKASAHACLATILAVTLASLWGPYWAIPGAAIAGVVIWSRWWLRKHTIKELIVGTLVGLVAGSLYSAIVF